jgi:phospholipase/carboxylesterase
LGKEIQSRPPVCLIHGDADQVVPYSLMGASEKILKSLDVPVVTHTRAGLGHGIDAEGLELTIAFLKQVLV